MRISRDILGSSAGPRVHEIDARWLMAYAAALGETAPERFDTTRPDGPVAHPLFPVCYEWPLALELRARTLTPEIAIRGVQVGHDLLLHRLPRAGDRLSTTAVLTGLEPRPAGACAAIRFETVDAAGRPVSTTDYATLYLGVDCDGVAAPAPRGGEPPDGSAWPSGWCVNLPIPATLAHVYTECARIWNPIHTDRAAALRAGLPDIILHGSATLALAVSAALRHAAPAGAARAARVACRFGAMVRLPSTLLVEGCGGPAAPDRRIAFRAMTAEGRPALREGWLTLGAST